MEIISIVSTLILLTLLSLLLSLLSLILKTYTGKSINNPEYPPVNGTVFHQLLYFNTLYDYQTTVAKTKYPTFRLVAPTQSEIYTIDPRNVEHILKTKFDQYLKGSYDQDIIKDLFGEGIFAVNGEKWRHQRKLASFEFSTRVLRDFSCSVFRRNASKLVRIVQDFAGAGRVFDMQDLLMRCTLDSIFKVGFGVDLNCLEKSSKEGCEFMKAFDDASSLVYWRYVDPSWKLKRMLNMGSEASLRKNIRLINNFVHQLIKGRIKLLEQPHSNDKEDILSRFLMESQKNPEKMNDQYLRDIILNFMIAGKDTSATTLSWFFYMLCKNPLIQEKVAQEVRDIVGDQADDETDPDVSVESLSDAALEQMHYLHSALTETLRLYPAVPIDGRSAESDDILPDGFRVKTGDGVFYMAYSMGRMPSIWGEDAEDFRPERWLKNGVFQPESPFKFISFHAGPRICLGKEFAYRQMKIVAMALLRYFRFELSDVKRNVTYRTMFTLHIDGGLPLFAVPRRACSLR